MNTNDRLSNDKFFRELVRAILAYEYTKTGAGYESDPDKWEKEVERAVKEVVPEKDIEKYRKSLIQNQKGIESLSEYFDISGPKNFDDLKNHVKSTYEIALGKNIDIGPEVKDTPENVELLRSLERYKEKPVKGVPGLGKDLWKDLEKQRKKQPPISRNACLKIINDYLDSFNGAKIWL